MTDPQEEIAAFEAQKYFAEICSLHGWDLKDLARESGYRHETLLKASRINSGVKFNAKMRDQIAKASEMATERSKFAEETARYRLSRPVEPFEAERVIHPIERGLKPVQPAARVLTAPLDKNAENIQADLMIELLHDYKAAGDVKRRWLAGQIRDMAILLAGTNETVPSKTNR